ncbi:germination protein YpeB [Anaerobacterium chartisolvens]|uniref:Germination protein YpeB n=1 Tax=Anaerobacterium chartisolvens TaxID=1297424 RepID=A0A369B3H0_9FIRM|nr:germination protein YpeB [Anaerobacterium chartisolvens]RCX16069.1 germination protein YpeB [Anaerobacterium chartisolvens]
MGLREKLLDFKQRLSDRKMYSVVIIAIAIVAIWGIYQYKRAADLTQHINNQYNRAFYDMVGYVNNVDVLLIKSLISASPAKTASTLQEAWRQANLAQENLGQLPVSQQVLANTSKFLTQVGDLSYSLNNQNMQGKALTEEQYKTIEKLYGYASTLGKSLNELQTQINSGRIKWGELAQKGTPFFKKASAQMPSKQFENIDKTFQDYPTLIYDGPFSDHLAKAELKGLTGDVISVEEGKKRVMKLFNGNKSAVVEENGKNDSPPIKTYSYKVTFENADKNQTAIVDITQKGGHLYQMLYNKPVANAKIDVDQAKAMGKKFLDENGYKNMKDTYYLKEDSTAVINYAYEQNGVVAYPDLIKVKISLDDGEVLGFESRGYISSHSERKIPKPKISEKEARKLINPKVKILSSGFAIIPTEYKTEIYTYEFKGKLNGRDFLIYINAETGREENVLMILETPGGILTI